MAQRTIRQSLSEIAGYTEPAAVHSDEDVWQQVLQFGVDDVATRMSITSRQLLDVLIPTALSQAETFRPSWFRRHSLDLVVICAVAGLAVLISRAEFPQPQIPQVVAKQNLAPFQRVRPEDLELRTAPRKTGAFDKITDVVGRFPLQPVSQGSVLAATELSAGPLPGLLQGRTILLLPLKLNKSKLPWSLPAVLTLVVSPRQPGSDPLVLADSWLLSLAGSDDAPMAYVAVNSSQLAKLASVLALSDVMVAVP